MRQSRSDALLLNIKTLDFSSDSHPKANDSSGKSKDAFDVYGIKKQRCKSLICTQNPGHIFMN